MVDTSSWEERCLSDLFVIKKGKRLTKKDQTPGDTIFIGASAQKNGITGRIGQEAMHEGNTISLTYNGSVGEAFYQQEPFWASDDVNVLYPKGFVMTPEIGLFFCTILRHEKQMWSYARKWNLEKMNATVIKVPINHGKLDIDFIQRFLVGLDGDVADIPDYFLDEGYERACWYLDHINQKEFEEQYAGKHTAAMVSLSEREWKEFHVKDLFKTYTGGDLIINDVIDGDIPIVTHTSKNNGIGAYTAEIEGRKKFDHRKTISLGDRGTFFAARQKDDFYIGTRVKAMVFIDEIWSIYHPSIYAIDFIVTMINFERFRFSYGRNCTNSLDLLKIKLPVREIGDFVPDWSFMDQYIKSRSFSCNIS